LSLVNTSSQVPAERQIENLQWSRNFQWRHVMLLHLFLTLQTPGCPSHQLDGPQNNLSAVLDYVLVFLSRILMRFGEDFGRQPRVQKEFSNLLEVSDTSRPNSASTRARIHTNLMLPLTGNSTTHAGRCEAPRKTDTDEYTDLSSSIPSAEPRYAMVGSRSPSQHE
jgi:hypothetical protein